MRIDRKSLTPRQSPRRSSGPPAWQFDLNVLNANRYKIKAAFEQAHGSHKVYHWEVRGDGLRVWLEPEYEGKTIWPVSWEFIVRVIEGKYPRPLKASVLQANPVSSEPETPSLTVGPSSSPSYDESTDWGIG